MHNKKTARKVKKLVKRSNFKTNTASLPRILKVERNRPSISDSKTWTIRAIRS